MQPALLRHLLVRLHFGASTTSSFDDIAAKSLQNRRYFQSLFNNRAAYSTDGSPGWRKRCGNGNSCDRALQRDDTAARSRPLHMTHTPRASANVEEATGSDHESARKSPDDSIPLPVSSPSLPRNTNWLLNPDIIESESDLANTSFLGQKLVDKPEHANDFDLWKELLLYRQRHYGDAGTLNIFRGLFVRGTRVALPTEGATADFLWQSFIDVAIDREKIMWELELYAKSVWRHTGKKWAPFYETVIGRFIASNRHSQALAWHESLKGVHLSKPNDIQCVFRSAMSSRQGLRTFRAICKMTPGHEIYGSVVPILWKKKLVKDALAMHNFFLQSGDIPQSIHDVEPLLNYTKDYGTEPQYSHVIQELVRIGIINSEEAQNLNSKVGSAKNMRSNSNDTTDANNSNGKKTHMKDEFGARLFATQAFAFELILGGLKMLGVEMIGPLTLRQMALRVENAKQLSQQIQALKSAGISMGQSTFAKVVCQLASRGEDLTLRGLIQSDQHPDVLEDLEIQESLLHHHLVSEDPRQVKVTLAILSILSDEDPHCYNVQFRSALKAGDSRLALSHYEKMKAEDIALSQRSISFLAQLLPPRALAKRPLLDRRSFKALWLQLSTYQQLVKSGCYIPPEVWNEGLKRLGMSLRWTELEKLCLWLADAYSPTSTHPHPISTPLMESNNRDQLSASRMASAQRTIFSPHLIKAIVAWGFMATPSEVQDKPLPNPFNPEAGPLIPWVRGIILLRRLKEKGISVHVPMVRRACRLRLATLFGEPRVSWRKRNRLLRNTNPWTLEETLADIDKAWGAPLFSNLPADLEALVNPPLGRRPTRRLVPQNFKPRHQLDISNVISPFYWRRPV